MYFGERRGGGGLGDGGKSIAKAGYVAIIIMTASDAVCCCNYCDLRLYILRI